MKIFFLCSIVATIILLNGCIITKFQQGIKPQTLLMIQLNMPETEFLNILKENEVIQTEFKLEEIKEHNVVIRVFNKFDGEVCSVFFVASSDGKILYWGYPYEFARHSDKFINLVGKLSYQRYLIEEDK